MVCRSLLIYLTVEVVALVMTWLLTEGTAAQGKMDGLTGYRLGSAARRKQHRRVEGGVQEAAVRRAADALDVELLQQCQLRAEWATLNLRCKMEVLGWHRQLMTTPISRLMARRPSSLASMITATRTACGLDMAPQHSKEISARSCTCDVGG